MAWASLSPLPIMKSPILALASTPYEKRLLMGFERWSGTAAQDKSLQESLRRSRELLLKKLNGQTAYAWTCELVSTRPSEGRKRRRLLVEVNGQKYDWVDEVPVQPTLFPLDSPD